MRASEEAAHVSRCLDRRPARRVAPAHAPGLQPRTRDRLEMVRLSAAGWSPPQIAAHLQISEQRVRHYLKAFLAGGFDALPDRRHPGMASPLTPAMEAALR